MRRLGQLQEEEGWLPRAEEEWEDYFSVELERELATPRPQLVKLCRASDNPRLLVAGDTGEGVLYDGEPIAGVFRA
jgi:hypothetical protein